jgi:hypothetical protein
LDFYSVYKTMVDAALVRPPQAEVEATQRRMGNTIQVYVRVTNRSGVTLSSGNSAAIHTLVYEEVEKSVAHSDTGRLVRAALMSDIASLASGNSITATLQTPDLTGVDWSKLHAIALVDYRPGGSSGAYDMLQAAVALTTTFTVQPDSHTFLVDPTDTRSSSVEVSVQTLLPLTWTAVANTTWLTITPSSGSGASQPTLSVISQSLSAGWQQGAITFAASDGSTDQVDISAYYGSVKRVYLPLVLR